MTDQKAIDEAMERGQMLLEGGPPVSKRVAGAVAEFLVAAERDMAERMGDGLRRGWGDSFQGAYSDDRVRDRLDNAMTDLRAALRHYRKGTVGLATLRKRAADVANQAFMMADPVRLDDKRNG